MTTHATEPSAPRIAVAIPCYNEAAAIAFVIEQYRAALPTAEIVVFDNNSTDGTGDIARGLGVRVVDVPAQGKGHAVQAAFATLKDADVVVLTDGDGTYPAASAQALIGPILAGEADMTVGARRPVEGEKAMAPVRGLGNILIRFAFALLIGAPAGDLLSGYRAFNKRFRDSVRLRKGGFEVETELASEAIGLGYRVVEIPVPYYPRVGGGVSKLRAFRDGRRIFGTIFRQGWRLRPWRMVLLLALFFSAQAIYSESTSTYGKAGLIISFFLLFLDDVLRTKVFRRGKS
ncbi:MAG: glycosyl transferase [Planctomycetes bacterium SCN 63-9]|nr:MAG: glycosyl transferase [Planctomycetes bacterium SCN 63-9]